MADTTGDGTAQANILGGDLAIANTVGTPAAFTGVPIGGVGVTGALPSADWSDATGSGSGWKGLVAVKDFTYTGSWIPASTSPALAEVSSGSFTHEQDGVSYTVTVGSGGTDSSTPYTWTSTDSTAGSGSGDATNGTAKPIGTNGITITFDAITTYASGNQYTIRAGILPPADALSLSSAQGTVGNDSAGSSPKPVLATGLTAVVGGGADTYGSDVQFVSAALNKGMGTYAVAPGAKVQADATAWAQTYTAALQYTLLTGP